MKAGASAGYTPGSLYRRHQGIGYAPGSQYKRWGTLGLPQNRNMSAMNRQTADSAAAAIRDAGPQVFEARTAESYGRSELAATQVMKRVQAMASAIAQGGESVSAALGGAGSTVDETV